MARGQLTGWSSHEVVSPTGAVQFEQLVTSTRPLVDYSEEGAIELGTAYWDEVAITTRRLVRVRDRDGKIALRLFGVLTLLRFGPPETVVDETGVLSRFPICGGLLARSAGGSITFSQTAMPGVLLRATIDGFHPRLGGRPGRPAWTGALYRLVQQRIHTNVSRRYFRRMIGEEPT